MIRRSPKILCIMVTRPGGGRYDCLPIVHADLHQWIFVFKRIITAVLQIKTVAPKVSSFGSKARSLLRETSGQSAATEFRRDPVFSFKVFIECPVVPSGLLRPRKRWADKLA